MQNRIDETFDIDDDESDFDDCQNICRKKKFSFCIKKEKRWKRKNY
jgi:hypothetical protein